MHLVAGGRLLSSARTRYHTCVVPAVVKGLNDEKDRRRNARRRPCIQRESRGGSDAERTSNRRRKVPAERKQQMTPCGQDQAPPRSLSSLAVVFQVSRDTPRCDGPYNKRETGSASVATRSSHPVVCSRVYHRVPTADRTSVSRDENRGRKRKTALGDYDRRRSPRCASLRRVAAILYRPPFVTDLRL